MQSQNKDSINSGSWYFEKHTFKTKDATVETKQSKMVQCASKKSPPEVI